MDVKYEDGERTWSNRYYCDLSKPCIYYDLALYSSLANIPDESNLFALTEEQWTSRKVGQLLLTRAVIDGVWQDYTAT